MTEYSPIPLLTTPKPTRLSKLFLLFLLLAAIPFSAIIFASFESEEAHGPVLPYVLLYFLALVVTVLLDYFAIVHIWKSESSEQRTRMLVLAWGTHSGVGYQALTRLMGWKMKEEERSKASAVAIFAGSTLIWIAVVMGGMFGESRESRRKNRGRDAELKTLPSL